MEKMMMMLLLVLVLGTGIGCAAPERNTVTHVKGFDGPLPFSLETGYVGVDGGELFYYFIPSERSPAEDPLILWITGGPGCTSLIALLFEIGPLRLDQHQNAGGLPRFVHFPDAWNKVSNVIFVDAPLGTGFSYATGGDGNERLSLTGTGRQLREFLLGWLARHPEFAASPLYIGGDSYSGYTVAVTAMEVADGPGGDLNLKGYMVGNAAADDRYDTSRRVPFLHGMGLISDELYEAARSSCGELYEATATATPQCASALEAISEVTSGINQEHVLEPNCGGSPDSTSGGIRTRLLLELAPEEEASTCIAMGYILTEVWADDAEVRAALGVREGTVGDWASCANLSRVYEQDVRSAIPYHRNLTRRGYRALVYTGDHDTHITVAGTQAWIRTLGYPVVAPWRPWYSDRQVAGFTTEYGYNLTFATVKGAGHMAPQYRPRECLHMLQRWTSPAGRL